MSITAWDIKEAAFSSDIKEVEELILTNKGATDVGSLSQAVNLRSLSLAFNSLSSLSGLAPLLQLQSLNVSHNQLASLKGLQALSSLVNLNASHNKIVSLAPLSGLTSLADLWLQNNAVSAPGELRVLGTLPGLQRLAIANNSVAKALPADHLRLVALRLCPGLKLIDGRPVEAAEREASERLDIDVLLAARPAAPGSAPAATPTLGSLGSLGSSRTGVGGRAPSYSGVGEVLPPRAAAGGAAAAAAVGSGRSRTVDRPLSNSSQRSAGAGTPDSQLPASRARRRQRCSSFTAGGSTGGAADPNDNEYGGSGGGCGSAGTQAAPALESMTSFSSTASSSTASAGAAGSGSSRGAALRGRRPPLPGGGGLKPAAQLAGTQFQAVLDALPRFDETKLPSRYSGAQVPRSRAPAPVKPPPEAQLVDYETKYPAQRGGGRAVVVRRDGSAAAFWPGGDMAVTVDAEYGMTTAAAAEVALGSRGSGDVGDASGGGGGGGSPMASAAAATTPLSYKMMVMYRAGGIAVSWDAAGGFVQYPSGGLMLMYSRTTGSGTCYSPSGDITRRWRDADADASPQPITIALPFPLAGASSPPPPPPPPPAHIDMQLDPHLGIRFVSATHTLELYLCCEGLRYRFRCGRNMPEDVWNPPPGRGDGSGGGSGSLTSASSLTTPYDSQPSTPTSSRATAGRFSGAEDSTAEEGLPPPAFLRNLARQGGAGTHRPTGAAARQASQAVAAAAAITDGGGGGGADCPCISSITAGLQALEEGLQAWLARDTKAKASGSALPSMSGADISPMGTGSTAPTSAAAAAAAVKPSPLKGRRTGGGSGVSAVRALAAEAADAGAVEAADAPADAASPAGSADRRQGSFRQRRTSSGLATAARPPSSPAVPSAGGRLFDGAADGDPVVNGGSTAGEEEAAIKAAVAAVDLMQLSTHGGDAASCTAAGEEEGGSGARGGIDSGVAAQLAAARKLAADSLAAAMAAANAASLIGSGSTS
ncbi:hypothetical protein Agub_g13784 [Astrephomene gubernaculifera]|uniref:Uncharacterized protein n=1 Tax=Astrephomene gubernaculifera TaxID=47775 RepID=A0AAD3E0C7_9CHLO|nr:hypothetical protein Agub_g13784 [Astrephomene gubernaculifera]